MQDRTVYHLALTRSMLKGATIALLPGDPARVEHLALTEPLERGEALANKREFRSWLAYAGDHPVLVTSTGIGGASTSIAVDELAQLGVTTFVRVGTTGAIQEDLEVGDVVVSTAAVRLDGASTHYAPIEYPAVAHIDVVNALSAAAADLRITARLGITCSSATFYPGQERHDSFGKYVPRHLQGMTEEWRRLNVLNYEMEAATLFTMAAAMGLRAGCAAGVVVNRTKDEHVTLAHLELGEGNAVRVAVAAAVRLSAAARAAEGPRPSGPRASG